MVRGIALACLLSFFPTSIKPHPTMVVYRYTCWESPSLLNVRGMAEMLFPFFIVCNLTKQDTCAIYTTKSHYWLSPKRKCLVPSYISSFYWSTLNPFANISVYRINSLKFFLILLKKRDGVSNHPSFCWVELTSFVMQNSPLKTIEQWSMYCL